MQPITAKIVQELIESFWKLNADRALLHTWHVGRARNDSHPILPGHVCDEFHYLPGFAPKDQAKEFHLTQDC